MEKDYKKLIFSINDDSSKRVYSDSEFLEFLQNVQLLDNTEELVSIDNYHHYRNEKNIIFAYDWEGGIYKINKKSSTAVLIDVFGIIKKIE